MDISSVWSVCSGDVSRDILYRSISTHGEILVFFSYGLAVCTIYPGELLFCVFFSSVSNVYVLRCVLVSGLTPPRHVECSLDCIVTRK